MAIAKALEVIRTDQKINERVGLYGFFGSDINDLRGASARIDRTSTGISVCFALAKSADKIEVFIKEMTFRECHAATYNLKEKTALFLHRSSATMFGTLILMDDNLAWFIEMVRLARLRKLPKATITKSHMN